MISKKLIGLVAALLCLSVFLGLGGILFAQDSDLTPAQIIAKHVNSIGKAEILAKMANRGMVGRAAFEFTSGATGNNRDGDFLCVSAGKNIGLQMKFADISYPGEYVAYNGQETSVADIAPGNKSPLGTFLFKYNAIMKEGYLGGAMSVAWPLLKSQGDMGFIAKREKDKDQEFYVLEKMAGDIKLRLFFDTATFRHKKTEYKVRIKGDVSANKSVNFAQEEQSTSAAGAAVPNRVGDLTPKATIQESEPDTIYDLVETFDEFLKVPAFASGQDFLILPRVYEISFNAEGHGAAVVARWIVVVKNWMNNTSKGVDQNFFVASIMQPKSTAKTAAPAAK
jgi:hypothetical protein